MSRVVDIIHVSTALNVPKRLLLLTKVFHIIFAVFLLNLFYRYILLHKPINGAAVSQNKDGSHTVILLAVLIW